MSSKRTAPLACAGALLLCACANVTPVTNENRRTPNMGGSAGQMGPGYCQTLPADVSDRLQWNQLCFASN
jgi:hypothetical protein